MRGRHGGQGSIRPPVAMLVNELGDTYGPKRVIYRFTAHELGGGWLIDLRCLEGRPRIRADSFSDQYSPVDRRGTVARFVYCLDGL